MASASAVTHVAVPIKPTPEMLAAGMKQIVGVRSTFSEEERRDIAEAVYRAMITALLPARHVVVPVEVGGTND
jgi:hypothetical protein